MLKMNKNKKGQAGFVVTVELLLIVVVLVIGLISGMAKLRDQTNAELSDAANAIGSIDNGYGILGLQWAQNGTVASSAGFGFQDAPDLSDASAGTPAGGDNGVIKYKAMTPGATGAATENSTF